MKLKPGLLFVASDGQHWLSCRRSWPDAPTMLCNLHSGELRAVQDVEGATFVSLSLDTLLRIICETRS